MELGTCLVSHTGLASIMEMGLVSEEVLSILTLGGFLGGPCFLLLPSP